MPWICPVCKRNFYKANQPHSCQLYSVETHLAGKDSAITGACNKLLAIVQGFGPVQISPTKNAIIVASKSSFLALKPKKKILDIEFLLAREMNEFPVHKTFRVSKQRVAHFVRIDKPEQIDEQLIAWLKEAFDTINGKSDY